MPTVLAAVLLALLLVVFVLLPLSETTLWSDPDVFSPDTLSDTLPLWLPFSSAFAAIKKGYSISNLNFQEVFPRDKN